MTNVHVTENEEQERPQAESRSVTAALQRVVSLHEGHQDGLLALDRQRRVLYWGSVLEVQAGITREEAKGRRLAEVLPTWALGQGPQLVERALAGVPGFSAALPLRTGLNTLKYQAFFEPLLDDAGHCVGVFIIIRDAARTQDIEADLAETEARFRSMADCAPVLLWMSETDSLCSFFNQTWLDFTGRTLQQEGGVGWAEGVHPEDVEYCIRVYMESFAKREAFEMTYRLRRRDGDYRWILDRGTPRYRPNGSFAGFIGSCTDITERIEANARAESAILQLRAANEDLEHFAHLAWHDLRAPLDAIERLATWTLQTPAEELSPDTRENVELIRNRARRLKVLLESLLEFATMGRQTVSAETVRLDALIREIWTDLEPADARLDLELSVLEVCSAVVPLRHVLSNLLGNAIQHHDGAKPVVTVAAVERGHQIVFHVRDDGPGIPQEMNERVFEPFQTLKPRDDVETSGVGLTLVKRLLESFGQSVRLHSPIRAGRGSEFSFTWPSTWKAEENSPSVDRFGSHPSPG